MEQKSHSHSQYRIKILVVDDEVPIREWIVFSLNKLPGECEVVGAASNGQEALAIFTCKRPDLVITDIIMPVMDGIELLREIRLIDESVRVVFLTSHSNFDYVRGALTLGAHSYILKTEIMQETLQQLVRDTAEAKQPDSLALHIRRKTFINNLLAGDPICAKNIEGDLIELSAPVSNSSFIVAAVKQNKDSFTSPRHHPIKAEHFENIHVFAHNEQTLLIVANIEVVPSTLMQLNLMHLFSQKLVDYFDCIAVSISSVYSKLDKLKAAVWECLRGLNMTFYKKDPNLRIICALLPKNDDTKLSEFVQTLRQDGDNRLELDKFFAFLASNPCLNPALIKKHTSRIASGILAQKLRDTTVLLEHSRAMDDEIQTASSFDELRETVFAHITASSDDMRKYTFNVRRALAYIDEFYSTDINLSGAAEYIGISNEHLSRIFKQELGVPFIKYLNTFRLERAMKLLRTTSFNISEVAERTGYKNLSYFSKLFRKHFGISPLEAKNT